MHAGAGGLLLLRTIVKIPMRIGNNALSYAFSCGEVIRNGPACADSQVVIGGATVANSLPINQNPYLLAAYQQYMLARAAVREGRMCNCAQQRERLRHVYRFLAGKV